MTTGVLPYQTLKQRAFELTTYFETTSKPPDCYKVSTGNFDGAGISFGAMQWQLKSGTLQPVWDATNDNDPSGCQAIFGADYNEWLSVQTMTTGATGTAVAWGDSITDWVADSSGHTIKAPWKGYFTALGGLQACQDAQVNATASYYTTGEQWKVDFGLWSRRGYALCYDIAIQAGGMTATCHQDILNSIAAINTTGKTRDNIEIEKMGIIWQRRLQDIATGSAAYTPFHDRKECIQNGSGLVYGGMVYTADYDINMEPAYQTDVLITDGIYSGSLDVDKCYLGNVEVNKIYNGAALLYAKAPVTTISPAATVQNSIPITITLSVDQAGATIYYKIGTGTQQTYTAPFTVNQNSAGVQSTSIPIVYWSVANGVTETQKSIIYDTSGAHPSQPVLTATAGTGKVDLSWTSTVNTTAYTIYRSTVAGTLGTWIGTTQYYATSVLSYSDTGVTAGTTYYYTIRAGNFGTPTDSVQKSATPTAAVTGYRYIRVDGYGEYYSATGYATTRMIEVEIFSGGTNRMTGKAGSTDDTVDTGGQSGSLAPTMVTDGVKGITSNTYNIWWGDPALNSNAGNAWVKFDLGASYAIDSIRYWSYPSRSARFKIWGTNNLADFGANGAHGAAVLLWDLSLNNGTLVCGATAGTNNYHEKIGGF